MYHDDHNASPVNPLPAAVVIVTLALALPELLFQAGTYGLIGGQQGIGWRVDAISSYGFFDTVFNWMLDNGRFPAEHMIRFLSYPFVNGNFSNAVFPVVLILAMGKMVAEAFSQLTFLIIFIASTLVGALAYGLALDTNLPLIGANPPAYGLIGAFTFMLFIRARAEGKSGLGAFSLIAFLLGLQLFFGLVFGGGQDWVADVPAFVCGFVLSFFLAPGGPERLLPALARLRRR